VLKRVLAVRHLEQVHIGDAPLTAMSDLHLGDGSASDPFVGR
jgi:hypothetical protein